MKKNLKLSLNPKGVCKLEYKLYQSMNQITAKVFLTFKDERMVITKSASDFYFLAKKINFAIQNITKDKKESDLCLVL